MRTTKYTLVLLLSIGLTACGVSGASEVNTQASGQGSTEPVVINPEPTYPNSIPAPPSDEVPFGYHAEKVPGSIGPQDLQDGLQVCVHLPTANPPQWNGEIVQDDGAGFMIREHLPSGTELNNFPYFGYGLTADPNGIWANVWMTEGSC